MTTKFRNLVFTVNNWTEDELRSLLDYDFQFLVVGKEVGEEGTPHLQGYAELKKQMRLTGIKKIPGLSRAHIEQRMGTVEQAVNYCKKDGDFVEVGEPKQAGKRTDLETLREMIKDQKEDYEIVDELTSLQAVKCIDTMRHKMIRPRKMDEKPVCIWLYGETGTGKSRAIKEAFGEDYDDCDYENGFLIGYTGKDVVVFEDIRSQIPLFRLLKMLDYGKCTVNVKGGSCYFGAKVVIFSCPFHPADVYKNVRDENIQQLIRRFDGYIWKVSQGNLSQRSVGNTSYRPDSETELELPDRPRV